MKKQSILSVIILIIGIIIVSGCVGQQTTTAPKLRMSNMSFVYFGVNDTFGNGLFPPCGSWIVNNGGQIATVKLTIENYGSGDVILSNDYLHNSGSIQMGLCRNFTDNVNGVFGCTYDQVGDSVCAFDGNSQNLFFPISDQQTTTAILTLKANSGIEVYYVLGWESKEHNPVGKQSYCGKSYPIVLYGYSNTVNYVLDKQTFSINCA